MNYQDCLQRLFKLQSEANPFYNLDNITSLLKALKQPHESFPSVHVAGTNGKGSVVGKISQGLIISGYKVGSFFSPHITDVKERIQINGRWISQEDFSYFFTLAYQASVKASLTISYFEILFAIACLYFQAEKVDIACIEVGLGGRLDATNVLQPLLCVITNVGFDHQHLLGDTLDKITFEKAGIIKKGIPILASDQLCLKTLKEVAQSKKAPLTLLCFKSQLYFESNTLLALKALEKLSTRYPLSKDAKKAVDSFMPPYRFCKEKFPGMAFETLILDGAHNPDGIEALIKATEAHFPSKPLHFLGAFSANKETEQMAALLSKKVKSAALLDYEHPRLMPAKQLKEFFPQASKVISKESLASFLKDDSYKGSILLCCGSFFFLDWLAKQLKDNQHPEMGSIK